ncbi:MAG TPA: ECF-type sigma factor [Longimicrobiales bacterium]|nr:ECF-type sigma factor [Longimicrobiales bacterium]
MNPHDSGDVTRLLHGLRAGDALALEQLLPLVYEELRVMARRQLARHQPGATLQPTMVVHDAWLKLARSGSLQPNDRAHFLAIAARAMRQVLVDHARASLARKRGAGMQQTTLVDGIAAVQLPPEDLIALDRALASLSPRQRQVVECRFFGGMEEKEIAAVLDISDRTVRREWVKARAWLYTQLYQQSAGETA